MRPGDPHSVVSRTPRWAWVVAVLVLAVGVLIAVWDWNWFKGPLERRVTAITGREFTIRGDLDVDLGWHPRITARDLHLANADWSKEREMAAVRELDLRISLWPALRGNVQLPYISLDAPRLVLERSEKGVANWDLGTKKQEASGEMPQIGRMTVKEGRLVFHEPVLKTDLTLDIHSGKPKENERAPLLAKGEGTWRGYPFELQGRVDSPLNLQNKKNPYRLDLHARAGHTQVHASGALKEQLQLENFNADFPARGR